MSRKGKIARLPRYLREKLNRRLDDGEPGPQLLVWLNRCPDVQEVLEREFGGRAVSEQNLSEWRQGGFCEWQQQQHPTRTTGPDFGLEPVGRLRQESNPETGVLSRHRRFAGATAPRW